MADDWQPACNLEALYARAHLLRTIRHFFSERGVLEVETPLLSQCSGTDPQLAFFTSEYNLLPRRQTMFLQTSPEFAMKRLLAAGSGSIFQISKAFRNGELGRYHNPEFTLLEWYRVGFSLTDLMNEIDQLFTLLFDGNKVLEQTQRYSYSEIFKHHTGLNPLDFSYQDYCAFTLDNQLTDAVAICGQDHTLWLDLLFSHYVQPYLGKNSLCMIYGYPACQSSLARLNVDNSHITDRVEIFMNGIELGNGYFELIDACEQEQRFDMEVLQRHNAGQAMAVKDHRLINAMKAGLPECSGMAIGLDRLLMILCETSAISDVLAFPIGHA